MTSRLNPYLHFNGQAREAMEYYADVFGGELTLNTFGSFGNEGPDAERIMHGQLETPLGFTLMGSDVMSTMPYEAPAGFTVSLSGDDGDALRGYFERLTGDGVVETPLEKMVWGDEFGAGRDRYGVSWLVNISQPA